jgi:manganese/iron transport system substrate-binding protein
MKPFPLARTVRRIAFSLLPLAPGLAPAETTPLDVMATTTLVADVVRRVGADAVALRVLIPADADPHGWTPRPADVARMTRADVVFVNGLGLEEFLDRVLRMPEIAARTVSLSEGITPRRLAGGHAHAPVPEPADPSGRHAHRHAEPRGHDAESPSQVPAHDDRAVHAAAHGHHADHDHQDHARGHHHASGEPDPHVWFDPAHVAHWARRVEQALAERRPEQAGDFARRRAAFEAELDALDAWIRAEVASIPEPRRVLAADHEVFGYFADRYGFRLAGTVIPGLSTLAQPSARELARFERRIRDERIPAIFVGMSANPTVARRIAADVGVPVVRLYTGALSGPDGPAADYPSVMRYNTRAIVEALR